MVACLKVQVSRRGKGNGGCTQGDLQLASCLPCWEQSRLLDFWLLCDWHWTLGLKSTIGKLGLIKYKIKIKPPWGFSFLVKFSVGFVHLQHAINIIIAITPFGFPIQLSTNLHLRIFWNEFLNWERQFTVSLSAYENPQPLLKIKKSVTPQPLPGPARVLLAVAAQRGSGFVSSLFVLVPNTSTLSLAPTGSRHCESPHPKRLIRLRFRGVCVCV